MGCGGSKPPPAARTPEPPAAEPTPEPPAAEPTPEPPTPPRSATSAARPVSPQVEVEVPRATGESPARSKRDEAFDESTYPEPVPPKKIKAEVFDERDYTAIDSRAKQASRDILHSYDDLISYLCPEEDEIIRARALFIWLITRIKEEYAVLSENEEDTPYKLLWRLNNGEIGLSFAYQVICREAGLKCLVILGKSKSVLYEIGESIERCFGNWVVVYINGEWRFVHLDWGRGAVVGHTGAVFTNLAETDGKMVNKNQEESQGTFVVNVNEFWFFTDPECMIYRHRPKQDSWQLLENPITYDEFEKQAYIREQYFYLDLQEVSIPYCRIDTDDGHALISFTLPEKPIKTSFTYNLYSSVNSKRPLQRSIFPETLPGRFNFKIRLTVEGDYKLEISGQNLSADNSSIKWICIYRIVCSKVALDNVPFPIKPECGYFGPGYHAEDAGVKVQSHDRGVIATDNGGKVSVVLQRRPSVMLTASLVNNNIHTEAMKSFMQTIEKENETILDITIPKKGEYALQLFAKHKKQVQTIQENVCNYLIQCERDNTTIPSLKHDGPETNTSAYFAGVKAITHLVKYIKTPDGSIEMKFKVPNKFKLHCELSSIDNKMSAELLQHYVDKIHKGDVSSVYLRLPQQGEYVLNIVAVDTDANKREQVLGYCIESAGNEKALANGNQSLFPYTVATKGITCMARKFGIETVEPSKGVLRTYGEDAELYLKLSAAETLIFDHVTYFQDSIESQVHLVKFGFSKDGLVISLQLVKVGKYSMKLFARQVDESLFGHVCEFEVYRDAIKDEEMPLILSHSSATIHNQDQVVLSLRANKTLHGSHSCPLRLVCVIDVSGSMGSPYGNETISLLDQMKIFFEVIVDHINEDNYLAIVTFDHNIVLRQPFTLMTADNKEKTKEVVRQLELGGTTNLSGGLFMAIEQFKDMTNKSLQDKIILFTDGSPNFGITESDQLADEMKKRMGEVGSTNGQGADYTISVAAVTVGTYQPQLLSDLSQKFSSETFYFIDQGTSVELNMLKPLVMQSTSVARNIKIECKCQNGVILDIPDMSNRYMLTDDTSDTSRCQYFIHAISASMSKNILLLLNIPESERRLLSGKTIIEVHVKYQSNLGRLSSKLKIKYDDRFQLDDNRLEPKYVVPVAIEVARLKAVEALRLAADDYTGGYKDKIDSAVGLISKLRDEVNPKLKVDPNLLAKMAHFELFVRFLVGCSEKARSNNTRWGILTSSASSLETEMPHTDNEELFLPKHVKAELEEAKIKIDKAKAKLSTAKYQSYYDKLEKAIDSEDEDLLREAIKEAEDNQVPDNEERVLTEAKESLFYITLSRELQDAINKEDKALLEAALDKANSASKDMKNDLKNQLYQARRLLDHIRIMDMLRHPIQDMKAATISELQRYKSPIEIIHNVLIATYLLFGFSRKELEDWDQMRKLLGKMQTKKPPPELSLLYRVKEFQMTSLQGKVQRKNALKADEILGRYEVEQVRGHSACAATFYVWSKGIIQEAKRQAII